MNEELKIRIMQLLMNIRWMKANVGLISLDKEANLSILTGWENEVYIKLGRALEGVTPKPFEGALERKEGEKDEDYCARIAAMVAGLKD